MSAVVVALIAYLGWSASDLLAIKLSRVIGETNTTFWLSACRVIFYFSLAPFFFSQLLTATSKVLVTNLLIGVVVAVGYWCFYRAGRLTSPALIGTIAGAWGAATLLFSLLIFHEHLNPFQWGAVGLIFFGLALTSLEPHRLSRIQDRGVALAWVAFFCWGLAGSLLRIPISAIGWFWATFFLALPASVVALALTRTSHQPLIFPQKKTLVALLLVTAGLIVTAEISYNLGLAHGLTSVVAPIAGSYATGLVLLSFIFFRDKLHPRQLGGVILSLLGIVLLSFLSV